MTWITIDKNVQEFAHKNLSERKNATFSIAMILLVLISAATNNHSVHSEAKSPNDDSVFYRIETSIRQVEKQFWQQSLAFLRRKREKLRKTKCYITIDETYDSYTGKHHKKDPKKLTKEEKDFIVETLKEISKELSFECALFDRGFYDAKLIDDLQKEKIPFIIRARLCDEMKRVFGIYRTWKSYEYLVSGWANTTLIIGKDNKNKNWGFVTNLQFKNLEDIRFVYKKRWNIENIFKATDGIQLRVATVNHITRMFAVCLSFLIYNAWQNKNKRSTLLEFMRIIFSTLLKIIKRVPRAMEFFKINQPLWDFITL